MIKNKSKWLPLVALGLLPGSCSAQPQATVETTPIATNTPQLNQWLKRHNPSEFNGKTWVRFRINEPQDYQYAVIIDSETNPYKPARTSTGTVWATGLQPKPWADATDWGKPMPWVAPATQADWLRGGQYSMWVEMPTSKAGQWHTVFMVRTKDTKVTKPVKLNLEFASEPSADAIFYSVAETTDNKGMALVRMPSEGGINGLRMTQSFTDWARRRRQIVMAMDLPPAPRVTQLRFGTWASQANYRAPGTVGSATPERSELDFQNFADLGLNSVTVSGINQELFKELSQKYSITDTTLTGWASLYRYTPEGKAGKYDYLSGETPPQRWTRVFDDYYRMMAARFKVQLPTALEMATHFNLGDEVHPPTNVKDIMATPAMLAYFRSWLRAQAASDPSLTPQFFGANSWEAIVPVDDRKEVDNPAVDAATLRRYYWTRRFINHYTILYFKTATTTVKKYFPKARFIAVNYQSGPVMNGFLGQNNNMGNSNLDIFEMGRQAAMQGVMMEDWVTSSDLGAGFVAFGADVMRSAARKHDLPLAAYVVGHVPRPRIYSWMMQGVKEFGLYLYGPISTIGPAWGEYEPTMRQIGEVTREAQKFEKQIVSANLRPTRAAMLIANTSDMMQRHGVYYGSERQQLYVSLRHSGVPVDLISEQDINEEDILKNYSLLYVTDPQVRTDVQRKIAGWVENGGRLWAGLGAMTLNEYSQPSTVLNPVLGVNRNTMVLQPRGFRQASTFYAARIGKFNFTPQGRIRVSPSNVTTASEITAWGARLDATPTTGRVLGSYEDNSPAIILNSYGRGAALLVGAFVGEAYMRERYTLDYPVKDKGINNGTDERLLATALVNHAGVTKPAELSVPGILTSVMDAPSSTIVFLNKAFSTPVPSVTIRIQNAGAVKAVESAKLGKVQYQWENGVVTLKLPLHDSDILRITK